MPLSDSGTILYMTAKEHLIHLCTSLPASVPPIHESAWLSPADIPFSEDVRQMCKDNRCGMYGKRWTCPPGVGEWEDLRKRYSAYRNAFVFTTCHTLEDSFDFEGMQAAAAAHQQLDEYIASELHDFAEQYVHLGAGACAICNECTYPTAPCRHPDRARQSMEACGINVVSLARSSGIRYNNGTDTVTYFSMLLFR